VLPGAPKLVVGAPRLVAGAPSYSEGRQECPPRVLYSPEIGVSNFTLHILSDTVGGFQFLKYILLMWQPSGAKTTATGSLLYSENESQRNVNSLWSCTFGYQGVMWIVEHITELLTSLTGKNSIYHRKNTDSKLIDIANSKTRKKISFIVQYAI